MFKSILTAAAFTFVAGMSHATQAPLDIAALAPAVDGTAQLLQVNDYCEWVTIYDAWGNWVTLWQCY